MFIDALFAVSALSLGASVPLHQDKPGGQDTSIVVTGEANKLNKRVCKRSVSTGSVMQKVTCRTLAEWNADTDRSLARLDRARSFDRWDEASRTENDLIPRDGTAPK